MSLRNFTESCTRLSLIVIAALTLFAFAPALPNGLVWDDNLLLVENQAYRGFSPQHLHWMFTTRFGGHYQPLTWLSYALDARLWGGANAFGFHLTNVLLHAATAIGLFFVARRLLTAATPHSQQPAIVGASLMAALLFAVHPLRVESVAWATERRDVLSGAWLMLTLILYLQATGPDRSVRRAALLAGSVVCYTLSLLSKAAGITLPFVLLLLDIYPLRRFLREDSNYNPSPLWGDGRVRGIPHESANPEPLSPPGRGQGEGRHSRAGPASGLARPACRSGNPALRHILFEKVLFAIPAILFAANAVWAQAESGALRTVDEHSIGLRIGQACNGLFFYLWKSFWPAELIPLYEQRPEAAALDAVHVLSAVFVVGVSAVAWKYRRRSLAPLIAGLTYFVLLIPVLGFAQSGPQVVADRYSYLSCMPWAVLAGGAAHSLGVRSTSRSVRAILVLGSVALVAMLIHLTRAQARVWADSQTLWTTVIQRAPRTGIAHANLASLLNGRGEYAGACAHARTALSILPGNRTSHLALARCSDELGDFTTAELHYRTALEIRPDDPVALVGLASVLTHIGMYDESEQLCRRLIEIEPGVAAWRATLAGLLAQRGRTDEARKFFEDAVRLEPANVEVRFRLSVILLALDEHAAAVETLREGLAQVPDDPHLNGKLAWIMATCRQDALRDGPRALVLAKVAMRREAEVRPLAQEALAAALAETGDYPAATETLTELLSNPAMELRESSRDRLQSQLTHYQAGQPMRELHGDYAQPSGP